MMQFWPRFKTCKVLLGHLLQIIRAIVNGVLLVIKNQGFELELCRDCIDQFVCVGHFML
jgi:hypothetical protein